MATERERGRITAALTDEQIIDAMGRALELRRRSAIEPERVTAQTLRAAEAIDLTRNYRHHSHGYRVQHLPDPDDLTEPRTDPWWWIGWVHYSLGEERQTWEVWLDIEAGRVWLKYDRPWLGDEGSF